MHNEYELTPAVKAQLAMLGLTAQQEEDVKALLENEFWRGHMVGEHDQAHRNRGIQIGDGNQQFNQF